MKVSQKKINKLFLKAIEEGDLDSVKYLLNDSSVKANLHLTNEVEDPEYCLLVATEYNQLHILKYFLEETELKKYTQQKGVQYFIQENVIDTVNIMYEHAGQNGNLEFIKYLTEKLVLEDKFQLFYNASFKNHVHIMDHMIKEGMLSKHDYTYLDNPKNNAMEWALRYNAKDSVNYLLKYYDNSKNKKIFNQINVNLNFLKKIIEGINKEETDFELFDIFFNDKVVQEDQEMLLKEKIFSKIGERNNFNLYVSNLKKIKENSLRKEIILDSYYDTLKDTGTLDDSPIFKYILENHASYFNKEDKESIFIGLIWANNQDRFFELMEYDFLSKGINPNKILAEAFDKIDVENTFSYIKNILTSSLKDKVKINYSDNYYFKMIANKLLAEEAIDLLTTIFQNYPDVKIKKIMPIFENKPEVQNFISKWEFHDKLSQSLPVKNNNIKKIKI